MARLGGHLGIYLLSLHSSSSVVTQVGEYDFEDYALQKDVSIFGFEGRQETNLHNIPTVLTSYELIPGKNLILFSGKLCIQKSNSNHSLVSSVV